MSQKVKVELEFSQYQYSIHNAVLDADVQDAPVPWRKIVDADIESVIAISISNDEEYILCTDGFDRWAYSLNNGDKISDNSEIEFYNFFDEVELSIKGFGPIDNEVLFSSGVYGARAGFHNSNNDGWRVYDFCSPYYLHHIILTQPNERLYSKTPLFTKILETATELICFGFSRSGKILIAIERNRILVYKLDN